MLTEQVTGRGAIRTKKDGSDIPFRLNQPIGLIIPQNRVYTIIRQKLLLCQLKHFWAFQEYRQADDPQDPLSDPMIFLNRDGTFYREIASDVLN